MILNATVEGILSHKNIYVSSSGGTDSFTIQDRSGALLIYTSSSPDFYLGARIRLTLNSGKLYYGQPEVTSHSSVEQIGSNYYSI